MLTAAVATALVPFNEGVEVLQGLGAAIAVIVLVLMTVVGNYRMSELAAPGRTGATSAGGAASYAELLSVMPLDTVLSEWRALDRGVGIPPGEQHWPDVVHVRGLLLDEMQRRDPVGFCSWMEDGAADDPERHIHDDPGLAA